MLPPEPPGEGVVRSGRIPCVVRRGYNEPVVLSRHRAWTAWAVSGTAVVLLASNALGARPSATLPTRIPPAERARLQEVAEGASVSAQASGEPFVARRDVFEFLLDHPELATHLTRALRLAPYRIWRGAGGLWLDDGWGVGGGVSGGCAGSGTRAVYAPRHFPSAFLPS